MAALRLGAVKTWVKSAAEEVSAQFGLTDIGGWRARGSVPNSDHPKGTALDFMTSDKARGDSIAAYLQANAKRLGVTYVIWNRRIWRAGDAATDWQPYNGPSPHTDHVHGSFTSTAPAGGGIPITPAVFPFPGGLPGDGLLGAMAGAADALKGMVGGVTAVGDLARKAMWLGLPTTQVRIVTGILGVGFLLVGVRFIVREIR